MRAVDRLILVGLVAILLVSATPPILLSGNMLNLHCDGDSFLYYARHEHVRMSVLKHGVFPQRTPFFGGGVTAAPSASHRPRSLPDGAAACVQEISSGKGSVRVRLHDKVAALESSLGTSGCSPRVERSCRTPAVPPPQPRARVAS